MWSELHCDTCGYHVSMVASGLCNDCYGQEFEDEKEDDSF